MKKALTKLQCFLHLIHLGPIYTSVLQCAVIYITYITVL